MKNPNMNRLVTLGAVLPLALGMTACGSDSSEQLPAAQSSHDGYDKYRRTPSQGEICLTYHVGDVIDGGNTDRQTLNWKALAAAGLRLDAREWTGKLTAANDNAARIVETQQAWAETINVGKVLNYHVPRPEDIITIGLDFKDPGNIKKGGNVFAITAGTNGIVPFSNQEKTIPDWAKEGAHVIDCKTLKPLDKTLPEATRPIGSVMPGETTGE